MLLLAGAVDGVHRHARASQHGVLVEGEDHASSGTSRKGASAATSGAARCAAMHRHAESYWRLHRARSWEELHCPSPLGFRPAAHEPQSVGTRCEAWIDRGAVFVLSRLLDSTMHALEWSTGSSSRYFLLWVASLHSVEHDRGWASQVSAAVHTELPAEMARRWRLDTIGNSTSFRRGIDGEEAMAAAFKSYVNVPLHRPTYAFVSVDGRARAACLRRVWHERRVAPGGATALSERGAEPPAL